MKLGLVGWASDTGVGMELRDAMAHLPVESAFILKHPSRPITAGQKFPVPCFMSEGWEPVREMDAWLNEVRPDTLLTWETPGDWRYPAMWEARGLRWFCVIHYDWFEPAKKDLYWSKAKLISPNLQCQEGLKGIHGLSSIILPIPVDLGRLPFKERLYAHPFVTVYGQGGPNDRRSIKETVEAWRKIWMAPPLTIRAQKKPAEIVGELPPQVSIQIGNAQTTAELYDEQDVAVMPSKFEGVGISLIEAQACGLPTITTDMEPMRTLAPDLIIEASPFTVEIMANHRMPAAYPSVDDLKGVVEGIVGQNIRELSHMARRRVEENYSWTTQKDRWIEALMA